MEATDRVFGRHAAGAPSVGGLDRLRSSERKPGSVAVLERDGDFAESLHRRFVCDALLDKALGPVSDRAFRDAEDRFVDLSDSRAARRNPFPREEGQDGAGTARRVAVVEMISGGIVEVDGLLDQPHAERVGVKSEISPRRTRDAGDVMNAACHSCLLFAA